MSPHFYIFCHGDRTWLYDFARGKFTRDITQAQRLTSKQANTYKDHGPVYEIVAGGFGRTVTQRDVSQILIARNLTQDARDRLRKAGATKARAYVARALKSIQGALNHARRMQRNQTPQQPKAI